MTAIESLVQTIESVTGLKLVVKGGNRCNPLEYFYSREGVFEYRFELDINGNDLLKVQEMADLILNTINDFGDTPKFNGASVDISGGGTLTKDNIITQVFYFNVIDRGSGVTPPFIPSGTIDITENGDYDVKSYANAHVDVVGGAPYEGSYVSEPRKVQQVYETNRKVMTDDFTVLKIYEAEVSNVNGTTLYVGKE